MSEIDTASECSTCISDCPTCDSYASSSFSHSSKQVSDLISGLSPRDLQEEHARLQTSLDRGAGTPCMHALATLLQRILVTGVYLKQHYAQTVDRALAESGQIPGMCILALRFYDGVLVPKDEELFLRLCLADVKVYNCDVARHLCFQAVQREGWMTRWPEDETLTFACAQLIYDVGLKWVLPATAGRQTLKFVRNALCDNFAAPNAEVYSRWALSVYSRLAEEGHLEAVTELGYVYKFGIPGIDADEERAIELLESVVEKQGAGNALTSLVDLYLYGGHAVEPKPEKAVECYQRVIDKFDDPSVEVKLASLLMHPVGGIQKDMTRARFLLEHGASKDSTEAMLQLADLLSLGEHDSQDHFKALELYERILELDWRGDRDDLWALDEHNFHSRAPEVLESIREDNACTGRARWGIVRLLSAGSRQLPEDIDRVIELFGWNKGVWIDAERSYLTELLCAPPYIERDDVRQKITDRCEDLCLIQNLFGMNMYGMMLCGRVNGYVARDEERAIQLFEIAMSREFPEATTNLAIVLSDSEQHPPIDIQRGVRLFEEAIEEEQDPSAMLHLANILRKGQHGIEQDIPRAMYLCEMSIAAGLCNVVSGMPQLEKKLSQLGISASDISAQSLGARIGLGPNEKYWGRPYFSLAAPRRRWYLRGMWVLAELLLDRSTGDDVNRALLLLEMALKDPGSTDALSNFSLRLALLRDMIQCEGNSAQVRRKALRVLETLVGKTGNTQAMLLLSGYALEGVFGVKKDTRRGINLLKRASFAGDGEAKVELGGMLYTGRGGMKEDRPWAIELFAQAIGTKGVPGSVERDAVIQLASAFVERQMTTN